MLKSISQFAVVTAMAFFVAEIQADETTKTCAAGKCDTAACEAGDCASCKECSECPVAAAMKKLPQITFAVGQKKTCCPNSAGELSKESGDPIQFVVAEKTFAKESDATQALVEATEKFVSAFAAPKVCKVSGTTTVAGKSYGCNVAAGHATDVVKAAMEKVRLTYQVGEKECHCPVEAKQVAEKSGKETVFVVAGEKTCCNVTARLNLVRAKYKAAIEAIVKAEAKEEQPVEES